MAALNCPLHFYTRTKLASYSVFRLLNDRLHSFFLLLVFLGFFIFLSLFFVSLLLFNFFMTALETCWVLYILQFLIISPTFISRGLQYIHVKFFIFLTLHTCIAVLLLHLYGTVSFVVSLCTRVFHLLGVKIFVLNLYSSLRISVHLVVN